MFRQLFWCKIKLLVAVNPEVLSWIMLQNYHYINGEPAERVGVKSWTVGQILLLSLNRLTSASPSSSCCRRGSFNLKVVCLWSALFWKCCLLKLKKENKSLSSSNSSLNSSSSSSSNEIVGVMDGEAGVMTISKEGAELLVGCLSGSAIA